MASSLCVRTATRASSIRLSLSFVRASYWDSTRWPGTNGRLDYANNLYAVFMLRQLEHLSLRIWDPSTSSSIVDRPSYERGRTPAGRATPSRPAERGQPEVCTRDTAGARRSMADSDRARSADQACEAVLHQGRQRIGLLRRGGPPRDSQGGRRARRRPLAVAASTPFAAYGLGVRRSSTARADTQLEFDGHGVARPRPGAAAGAYSAACVRQDSESGWRSRMRFSRACPPIPSCF